MLEQLNRYFTAAHNFRRSERAIVRTVAVSDLEEMQTCNLHPKLRAKVGEVLNEAYIQKMKANG